MALTHEAFFYSSDDDFAERLVPFLQEAIAADQGAIAVTTEPRIAKLRRGLGIQADAVSFFDATRWYRRPGAALVAWRDAFDQQFRDGVESVRAIGEIAYGDHDVAIRNWTRYESVVNRAFAAAPVWFACAYNTETLPEAILEHARRTHPVISTRSERVPSAVHFGEKEVAAALGPVDDEAGWQERTRVTVTDSQQLIDIRRDVRWEAQAVGLDVDTVDDLLLAVSELLRTLARRGGGECHDLYCASGRRVVLRGQVGPSRSDALAAGGSDFGLLIGRVIGERVELADAEDGTVVRFVFGTYRAIPGSESSTPRRSCSGPTASGRPGSTRSSLTPAWPRRPSTATSARRTT